MHRTLRAAAALLALLAPPVFAGAPAARVVEVTDTYFGTEVVDPYRWMESDPTALAAFLKEQGDHTQKTMAQVAGVREKLYTRIESLMAGTETIRFVQRAGDRWFYLSTPVGAKDARLVTRPIAGGEPEVLLEVGALGVTDGRVSIDFYATSPDGMRVVVAASKGGSEDWIIRVYDLAARKLLDDAITDIVDPFPGWAADGSGFYYARLRPMPEGAPETTKYDDIRVYHHAIGTPQSQDRAVFGPGVDPSLELPSTSAFPDLKPSNDGRWLVGEQVLGTEYSAKALYVSRADASPPRWRKVADPADKVSTYVVRGDAMYALSSRDAPNGRVLRFPLDDGTIAGAKVVVPEGETIMSADTGWLAEAKDALYVIGTRGGNGTIVRVPYEGGTPREVPLPSQGYIGDVVADERSDGIAFTIETPALSPRLYGYDPADGSIEDTGVRPAHPADFSGVVVRRVEVESTHGARVPMTIVAPKDLALDGSHPTLLGAYGSYGAIAPVGFVPQNLAWYERGNVYAFVHARGGGENGVAWHEAARKTTKQRTIDDAIAAARWLIANGYTSPKHLAIVGKSAGGIPSGGAITQAPELFGAALLRVAVTDLLRIELSGGGPANTAEYGSVKNEAEFRSLRAISPYANVRHGVRYPAVMLETGANDPRVPPWQLAKMAARLQAATASHRPVLLRVDYDAGHGLGSDRKQQAALLADEYAFLTWQLR